MKPIETIYNGFRFRSRLEARWAVFFDAVEIKYEYEIKVEIEKLKKEIEQVGKESQTKIDKALNL